VSEAQTTLRELAGLLGLTLTGSESESNEAGPFIELLIETRAALRKERQFALADQVRDRLIEMGVALEDTADGTEWEYRRS
jgi:cysteinyl-tRNA synthetase